MIALLRPFDMVSTALYAVAFRAGRHLGCQVRERRGEASRPAEVEAAPEAAALVPVSSLPGVTIEGVDFDPYQPTPENSYVVDLRAEGDEAFYEARWAEVLTALEAGKAVLFGDIAADQGLFSIGKVEDRYLVMVGIDPPSNYADLNAAMRHGFSAIEVHYHG